MENDNCKNRSVLFQSDFFEVVAIEWTKSNSSQLHSHGWSQCYVSVEEGTFENTLDFGNKVETTRFEAGQAFHTPLGTKHEMRCISPHGKTLHVYSPKIAAVNEETKFYFSSLNEIKDTFKLGEATRLNVLQDAMRQIRHHSISTSSPYFMNQLFSGVPSQMLLAEDLISQTKTTLATYEASPALSTIENEVVDALGAQIGWAKESREGVCVPGGSSANFMAIHCARQKSFPDLKKTGMSNLTFKVYVSSEAHYSFKKACAALGIGTDNLVYVPVDKSGRMLPDQLNDLIKKHIAEGAVPLLVGATAGTTVLGAFDSLTELSEVCNQHKIWLHVDGAWGGPAIFSKQLQQLVRGIEKVDSMTFDAHKLFGANLTCSFLLTRHPGLLLEANDVAGGEYLFHSDDPTLDRGKLSWQCGRKADAMSFWAIWKSLGTVGLGKFVDNLISIRDETLSWIKTQPRLQLVATPDYLNICVRVLPPPNQEQDPNWSLKARESMKQSNRALVNYSTDDQGSFLRLILAHPHLQFENVKQILNWALEVDGEIE
jgi:glutamate/tyrosine decarboxylase-like PLP-dependent enzyme/quercetin dioxygenase-like cupin family protein